MSDIDLEAQLQRYANDVVDFIIRVRSDIAEELEAEFTKELNDVLECNRRGYCSDWECFEAMKQLIVKHIARLRGET